MARQQKFVRFRYLAQEASVMAMEASYPASGVYFLEDTFGKDVAHTCRPAEEGHTVDVFAGVPITTQIFVLATC